MNGELNYNEYHFPKADGDFFHNAIQKVELATGKKVVSGYYSTESMTIRTEEPLSEEEVKSLNENVFKNPSTAANRPESSQEFCITDIWDSSFREDLGKELGCTVSVWFSKSDKDLIAPDKIYVQFSKKLSADEKALADKRIRGLMVGW